MKRLITLLSLIFIFSCGEEKSVLLPEIKSSKISKVLDVSPAYIFYDETKPDSTELNRKNLIISTNWLVNIDRRLTLKQVTPSILKLQNKKRNAKMHKNEASKNYYTCNDTSIKNLGFIDFTEVFYQTELKIEEFKAKNDTLNVQELRFLKNEITFNNESYISLKSVFMNTKNKDISIVLSFDKTLSFQDYITYKSTIEGLKTKTLSINNNEFIY